MLQSIPILSLVSDFEGFGLGAMALSIPIIFMLLPVLIVLIVFVRNYKVRKLEHEERLRAIEKGVALPPFSLQQRKPVYPFAAPFVNIGLGLAFILWSVFTTGPMGMQWIFGAGLVLLFVGLGLFASRFIGVKKDIANSEANRFDAVPPPPPGNPPASGQDEPRE